ncbi:MAG: 2-C-methyl-D-erythritol 2,4-cyclodiphosphate synthase, partial [Candidatus Limnocylindrales bacterium]
VPGGARRQDSVAAGVQHCDAEVVLVHDGARPFPSVELVDAVAEAARVHGAAIPVLAVVDSLKRIEPSGDAATAERDGLFRAQTPQGARRETLVRAFAALDGSARDFGDEASILEAHGIGVVTVPGEPTNLKVTEPGDLALARAVATMRSGPPRYATASDTHPFGPDDGLALGGITIPEAARLSGHSDGDVVLHAVADAMLGAAGMPDLGRQFPASDMSTAGVASTELFSILVDRIAAAGWQARSADVTIIGARPHLGGRRLDAMRQAIADLLGLGLDDVGVKASTGNLVGPEGAGSVITAHALVAISRR